MGSHVPGELVGSVAVMKAADDASRLTDEELFKLIVVLLFERLGRLGLPLADREPFVDKMYRKMLADAVSQVHAGQGRNGEPS